MIQGGDGRGDHCCKAMCTFLAEGSVSIIYWPHFREYGIRLVDQEAIQGIAYCPWCGSKLPTSLRNARFDILEQLGYPAGAKKIPSEFKSDEWWKSGKYASFDR